MKETAKGTRLITLALMLWASSAMVFAQSVLHDLDIRVELSRNGDARITETRLMTIDNKGTECYIGLSEMSPSTVKDLSVSDESRQRYENIGEWKVDRSRSEKAGRCGIVEKGNGSYELCWGLGDSGQRTYVTSYTITGLVRGYPDADALRHVFLDENVSPKPIHAKVTIVGADTTLVFTPDTCGIWGFRFYGELGFENGTMVAETTAPMDSEAALYIMAKFPKGMLEPAIQTTDDTFEHKKQLALEGSDYVDVDIEQSSDDKGGMNAPTAMGILGGSIVCLGGILYYFSGSRSRKKRKQIMAWTKSVDYFKSIPLEGNLQQANDMLNAFNVGKVPNYKRLISATILHLINEGVFSVEPMMTEAGKMAKRFVVKEELPVEKDWSPLAYKMHEIFNKASGENHVLDPKELETFMENDNNRKVVKSFLNALHTMRTLEFYENHKDEVCEVFGFKRFLEDFTLMNERHLTEAKLWNDYMVWATLYGNAEQVIKDMKAINPEFFKMDQVAIQLSDNDILPIVYASVFKGTDHVFDIMVNSRKKPVRSYRSRSSSSRSSGGGGRSSYRGGGGGFSGRGGGGGIR